MHIGPIIDVGADSPITLELSALGGFNIEQIRNCEQFWGRSVVVQYHLCSSGESKFCTWNAQRLCPARAGG